MRLSIAVARGGLVHTPYGVVHVQPRSFGSPRSASRVNSVQSRPALRPAADLTVGGSCCGSPAMMHASMPLICRASRWCLLHHCNERVGIGSCWHHQRLQMQI